MTIKKPKQIKIKNSQDKRVRVINLSTRLFSIQNKTYQKIR